MADEIGAAHVGDDNRILAQIRPSRDGILDAFARDLLEIEIGRLGPPIGLLPTFGRRPIRDREPAGEAFGAPARAIAINLDIAHMAGLLGIAIGAVIVEEPGGPWRHVEGTHQRELVALEAMDDHLATGREAVGKLGIVAERIARAPERGIAGKADAARSILVVDRKADGVLIGLLNPVAVLVAAIAQHAAEPRRVILGVVETAEDATALGQDHAAAWRKQHVRDGKTARHRLDLDADVARGRTVGADRHRPDLRAVSDGVIEPAAKVGQPPDPALARRQAPGGGVGGIEGRVRDVHARARIHRHRGEARRRAPLNTVVVGAKLVAGHVEPVNDAGIKVGHEELEVGRIKGDVAKARAAVGYAAQFDVGKERHLARLAVDAVDRARPATEVGAELAFHEGGARLARLDPLGYAIAIVVGDDDLQAMHRRCRDIDVGRVGVIERDAEHLADVARERLELDRAPDHLAACLAPARNIEDAQRGTVGVDELLAAELARAGKAGDGEIAIGHNSRCALLSAGGGKNAEKQE